MFSIVMVVGAVIVIPIVTACIFHAMLRVNLRQGKLGRGDA